MNETVKKNRQVDKNKKVKIYKYLKDDTEKLLTKVYNKIDFMQNEGGRSVKYLEMICESHYEGYKNAFIKE